MTSLRNLLTILLLNVLMEGVLAQTCCSGGVPISNSLGFSAVDQGVLQLNLSADLNVLTRLFEESNRLIDQDRQRTTQSLNLRAAYTLSTRWAAEMFVPIVKQTRKINAPQQGTIDFQSSFGVGDPVFLLIYDVIKTALLWRVGVGPQVPLGRTNFKSDRGLLLVEDLQPGSGAWDAIFFSSFLFANDRRPTRSVFLNTIYTRTGKNPNSRDGAQTYQFGRELQVIAGVGDQVLVANQLWNVGFGARYRNAQRDRIDGFANSGTGGQFLFSRANIAWVLPQGEFSLMAEVPIFTRVNETQLASSYLLNVGYTRRISWRAKPVHDEINNQSFKFKK